MIRGYPKKWCACKHWIPYGLKVREFFTRSPKSDYNSHLTKETAIMSLLPGDAISRANRDINLIGIPLPSAGSKGRLDLRQGCCIRMIEWFHVSLLRTAPTRAHFLWLSARTARDWRRWLSNARIALNPASIIHNLTFKTSSQRWAHRQYSKHDRQGPLHAGIRP
jgi:hypothetical protein